VRPPEPRAGRGRGAPVPVRSRAQSLPAGDPRRDLPRLGDAAPLAAWLLELGPVCYAGMGEPTGVDWPALESWQRCTGTALTPWQARALVLLSADYAHQLRAAAAPDCPAPDYAPADAGGVRRQVLAVFGALGA
jgi:hypothetical protein